MTSRGRAERDARAIAEAVLEQRMIEQDAVHVSKAARLQRNRNRHLPSSAQTTSAPATVRDDRQDDLTDGPLPFFRDGVPAWPPALATCFLK